MSDKAFTWPVRVYYEDTDIGGIVYHANYLKFMERARTEWFRSMGVEQDVLMRDEDTLFVVVRSDVTFRKPARFNELLYVTASADAVLRTNLMVHQEIRRGSADGELICTGIVRAACLAASTLKPRRLPAALMETLA